MTVRISVSIMAHPYRQSWAEGLSVQLSAPISWDVDNTEWHTGRRAWQMADHSADFHLVVQDDAIVHPEAIPGLVKVLERSGHDGPASLYVGTGRPRQPDVRRYARGGKDGWFTMPWLLWGVAIALPVEDIDAMLSDVDESRTPYDRRISRWYEAQNRYALYTWPCLADHRDEESLVGNSTRTVRRALKFKD